MRIKLKIKELPVKIGARFTCPKAADTYTYTITEITYPNITLKWESKPGSDIKSCTWSYDRALKHFEEGDWELIKDENA